MGYCVKTMIMVRNILGKMPPWYPSFGGIFDVAKSNENDMGAAHENIERHTADTIVS